MLCNVKRSLTQKEWTLHTQSKTARSEESEQVSPNVRGDGCLVVNQSVTRIVATSKQSSELINVTS